LDGGKPASPVDNPDLSGTHNLILQKEIVMKKMSLLFVLLFAAGLYAQDAPSGEGTKEVFAKSNKIKFTLTSISLEQYGPMKADKTFKAGETVYINLTVKGLKANESNQVTVQADLAVPELGLDSKNILNDSTDAADSVPVSFYIPIESVERGGVCNVTITLRDMNAKTMMEYKTTFKITP
jgi:hypothetical protein